MAEDFKDILEQPPSFNLGLATINRVNERFVKYAEAYATQEWSEAFIQLDLVYQEVDPFLENDERDDADNHYNTIIKEINELDGQMVVAPKNSSLKVQSDLPKTIRKWSLILRRQAHKHKIYMPMASDPRFASMR